MASIRIGTRKDGSTYVQVLFRHDGKQTSKSFHDYASAAKFRDMVKKAGPARALEMLGVAPAPGLTVAGWLEHYIDHLTGLQQGTVAGYRRMARADINPTLGHLPLAALSREDCALWVKKLEADGAAGKTIANKHGFLSAALNAAVRAGKIPANPAAGQRLPRTERTEMVCLSREEFGRLLAVIDPYWRPLVEFLVASGARWGEATALRPTDVDRDAGTVRISRAWKRHATNVGFQIGPPKTSRSTRTIDLPASVLDKLEYGREFVFLTPDGRPVRGNSFYTKVWAPAVTEAKLDPRPRVHDLRHTCASWLIQAGVPLPVIQAHLGHESIKTTIGVYGHLDRRAMSAAATVMAQALDPHSKTL